MFIKYYIIITLYSWVNNNYKHRRRNIMKTIVVREERVVVAVELAKTTERAARRAATAKKAAKVAAEAARFEGKKAWKQPERRDYMFKKAANATVGNYMFIGHMAHDGFTVINTSKKDGCHGGMASDIADYFAVEARLDSIESTILRKYEEYEALVEEYKRYKSQWDWGTYDCFEELMEDINKIEDKIYDIGEKFFDTLVPEYRDTCIELGYTPNIEVVFAEQWRYY